MTASKTLIIVRHAKSSWKDETLADRDRPLNQRGIRDAPEMGRRLAAGVTLPQLVVSSPAVRALETARAICREIDYSTDHIQLEEDLYAAAPHDILDVVTGFDDSVSTAMVVTHNPAITDLANLFSDEDIENVPTCGILFVEADAWNEFSNGRLIAFDYPKNV